LWGIKLSPLDITYEKRKAIKSHVLPNFTAEWLELQNTGPPDLSSVRTMYFDGLKRVKGSRAGVVLISPQEDKLKYVLRMSFPQASNNEVEYKALLHGMKMAKACGATRLRIFWGLKSCGSASNELLRCYQRQDDRVLEFVLLSRRNFRRVQSITHQQESNEEANNLANIGSQCLPVPLGVF
jgi:hypothetical protein